MTTLREALQEAKANGRAIGHFNVSELAALRGILAAAQELAVPVLIGVSEGERAYIGVRQIAALIASVRETYAMPVFLNADHTHSLDKVKEAAEAGFDEILFDGSKLPFDENIRDTKQAVNIVRSIRPEIVVEGEIGYIGSSSEILEEAPAGASLAAGAHSTVEEAKQFITATGVDVLAPAVGNMHGLLKSMVSGETHKRLDIQRIKEISDATGSYMTLHGGSGTADEDFAAATKAGMTIVHVSTELRVAWRKGIEAALSNLPNEVAPYKILPESEQRIKEIVRERLMLFNRLF